MLVDFEEQAFALARAGQHAQAQAVLSRPDYKAQKQVYAQGITQFITDSRTQLEQQDQQQRTQAIVVIGITFSLVALGLLIALLTLRYKVVQPLRHLAHATTAMTSGYFNSVIRITSQDAIGTLQHAFNTMTRTIQEQTQTLQEQVTVANQARREAETARKQSEAQLETIQDQQAVIREMSVPMLPLMDSAIVMPLIGALDTTRLSLVQEQALSVVEHSSVRHLLLDVTGVPVIDTQVAQGLLQVMQALRLLGAEVVLVGIRPEVAHAIVSLGIDLSQMVTRNSLQSGIAYVLNPRSK
jgi:rsbT co-antagonist protein RsbR